jgi:hypothetical protein
VKKKLTTLVSAGSVLVVAKTSDTHVFLPIFTTALVLSCSMDDRWNYQLFTMCLDPSSV